MSTSERNTALAFFEYLVGAHTMHPIKSSPTAVFIGAVFAAPAAPTFVHEPQHAAAVAQAPSGTKVTETDAALRDLWLGHIFWVRNVLMETLAHNTAAAAAAENEIVANAKLIAAAIEPYYGILEATVRTRFFRARSLMREGLSRDMDLGYEDAFNFDGERYDRIVLRMMERLSGSCGHR